MPRKKRKRPNWPYRLAWLAICSAIVLYVSVQTAVGGSTFAHRSYGTDWGLALIAACLDATFAVWFFAVGASIGSFLNVVAFRLPLGRHIGGHSGCFYCQTPIRGSDNVPVLAWIKLRGRCRTCRLPISIQYPLVEFFVGLAFLVVYVTEIASSGGNLPGVDAFSTGSGLLRMKISWPLIVRALTFVFALSGLIAAALIAARRKRIPLHLFAWSITPWLAAILLDPSLVVIRWRESAPEGMLAARLDAFTTFVSGMVVGIAVARLLAPILYPNFDRRLMSPDEASTGARQFIAGMGIVGALLGWQSVVPLAWTIAISAMLMILILRRFRSRAALGDLLVWVWLGTLVFRANWSWLYAWQLLPDSVPTVFRQVLGALMLAPLGWVVRRLSQPNIPEPQIIGPDIEPPPDIELPPEGNLDEDAEMDKSPPQQID